MSLNSKQCNTIKLCSYQIQRFNLHSMKLYGLIMYNYVMIGLFRKHVLVAVQKNFSKRRLELHPLQLNSEWVLAHQLCNNCNYNYVTVCRSSYVIPPQIAYKIKFINNYYYYYFY